MVLFKEKLSVLRAGKGITLVISKEYMDDDIIRMIKSLNNSGVVIDGVSETK